MKTTMKWKLKKSENLFIRIEASKLTLQDKFMQYEPRTNIEKDFKKLLSEAISQGIKDFYRPRIDPSFSLFGTIIFKPGRKPAVGKSYNWWEKNAKKFNPKRKSRLGTKYEYVAFLGVIMKKLIEEGWSVEGAWHVVCNDSKKLGHYWNSQNAKLDFEVTGWRKICGFFDLANTWKILAADVPYEGFFLASGCYRSASFMFPLAHLRSNSSRNLRLCNSLGWIVFE